MNPVADNPLLTRGDLALAARQLMEPLIPCLTPGRARMITGEGWPIIRKMWRGWKGIPGCCGPWCP